MRSAVLTAGDDLAFDGPRRRAPTTTRKAGAKRKSTGKATRSTHRQRLHTVTRFAAIGCSALVVVGILVNALMLQKGHHPAPLFAASTAEAKPAAPVSQPAAMIALEPKQATASVEPASSTPTSAPARAETAPTEPAVPIAKERVASTAQPHDDAIARLLAGGPQSRPTTSAVNEGSKVSLIAVQKALARQGFPVGTSGRLDANTRKALERYQISRHLPTKDPIGARTLKSLGLGSP